MSSDATDNTMRAEFQRWWRATMNTRQMDLHRFGDGYACHETNRSWMTWQAARADTACQVAEAVAAEREACAALCDVIPPYPFRPSIEAAHAIRARSTP